MYYILASFNLLLVMIGLVNALRQRQAIVLYWAGVAFVHAIPAFGDLSQSTTALFDPSVIEQGLLFAVLLNGTILLSTALFYGKLQRRGKDTSILGLRMDSPIVLGATVGTFMVGGGILVRSVMGSGLSLRYSDWHVLMWQSDQGLYRMGLYLIIATLSVGAPLALKRRWKTLGCFLIAAGFIVILFRMRLLLVPLLLPFIWWGVIKGKTLTLRRIAVTGVFASLFMLGVGTLRSLRWEGQLQLRESVWTRGIDMTYGSKSESENRKAYYTILSVIPEQTPYLLGQTYLRVLLLPLPSTALSGIKPEDPMYLYGRLAGQSVEGYSVHPLIYGDVYANFGFIGFVLGVLFGIVFAAIEVVLRSSDRVGVLLMFGPVSVFYLLFVRGAVYHSVLWLVVGWIVLRSIAELRRLRVGSTAAR